MHNVKFSKYGGGVGGQDHLLEVVDDDFVAAIGAERGLNGLGDCATCFNVAYNGAIFGFVATGC